MGWIGGFRASEEIKRAAPLDETAIKDAPYNAHKAVRGNLENPNPAAPGDRPGAQMPRKSSVDRQR